MKACHASTFGLVAVATLGFFLVGGCASSSSPGEGAGAGEQAKKPPASAREQLAGEWLAVSIQGEPVDKMMAGVPIREFPSLALVEDDRVAGSTAVNRWSAQLDMEKAESGAFVLGSAISTRMAGPPEVMKVEQRFLAALEASKMFSITDGVLILKDAEGKETMRFSKVGKR
jgi:heat shock protein HslJ